MTAYGLVLAWHPQAAERDEGEGDEHVEEADYQVDDDQRTDRLLPVRRAAIQDVSSTSKL